MSEQPENSRRTPSQGQWFTPSAGTTPPSPVDEPATRLPALPPGATRERTTLGGWHLPAAEQTPFTPGQEIILTGPFYTLPESLFPEDSLSQLMTPSSSGNGQKFPAPEDSLLTPRALPAPEDFVTSVPAALAPEDSIPTSSPFSAPEDSLPAPEDAIPSSRLDDLLASQQAPAPEDTPMVMEPLRPDGVEAPSDVVDEDEEDTVILRPDEDAASLVSPAETASALDDLTSFAMDEVKALEEEERRGGTEPLNPAELALYKAADTATEMMPSNPEPAAGTSEEDAAAYAARMADELIRQAQSAEASQAVTVPQDNFERSGGLADLSLYGEGTGRLSSTRPMLSPEDEALAEKYRETQRQVASLREQYQRGQITYDDLQQRLRPLSVLDNEQVWWMLGFETDKWYRFDNMSQQWVEDEPPVPLTDEEYSGFGSEVQAGSMPYIPDAGAANTASQIDFATGNVGTPVPRPGQPLVDPNATMVGNAYNADYLNPQGEDTYANPNLGTFNNFDNGATIPSAATIPSPAINDYDYGASPTVTSPMPSGEVPDYDMDNAYTPQFDQTRLVERNRTAQFLALGAASVAVILLLCGVFSVVGLSAWADSKIEPYKAAIAGLSTYSPPFQTVKILDARGALIAELNSQQGGARELVSLENGEISPFLVHAILSVENSTYYNDAGYDPLRIGAAFWQNLVAGEVESGASTITQQIAKNLILNDTTVSAERKIDEILVANKIAQDYSKNDILNLYLNQFYFGNQSYGVEAAAQFYFGKSAKDVNMAESAMLAGLIQSPAGNDPVVNLEQAKAAMYNVIRLMLETGCIQFQHGEWEQSNQPFCIQDGTQVMEAGSLVRLISIRPDGKYGGLLAVQLAKVETRQYLPRQSRYKYPHFVNFIQSLVEQEFGPDAMFQRGFTIYTTLEPRIQDTAQDALARQVAALINNGVNTGAVMVVDPKTGAIRAMVGSPDFTNEQFAGQVDNTRTYQQPGSAIKPILYSSALEGANGQYFTPSSILWDVPTAYTGYRPENFDRQYRGPVPLRNALASSLNIPAVKMFEMIGAERFQEMAGRLQLRFVEGTTFGLPSALGANDVRLIDMMKAYSIFANSGTYAPLHAIVRITEDANGTILDVPRAEAEAPSQKITPQVAYLIQNILSDDPARASQFGTNSNLTLARLGIPTQNVVAAKSGTSNDNRDLWTMGFTSNAVVGVWLGTYNNDPTIGTTSSSASEVWNKVMEAAISGRAPAPFANPGGIVQDVVCRDTGTIADNTCAAPVTDIYIQNQPPPPAGTGFVQAINVDSWTGKIANEWCPQNAVAQTFANINDPFAIDWLNRTPAGQAYKQRIGLPNDLRPAPTQACAQGEQLPAVSLVNPAEGATLTGPVTITGQISAPNFAYYQLEYASASAPEVFTPIGGAVNQPLPNNGSPVGTWDTRTVPNGQYILRLAVFSSTNGYIFRSVRVNLNNIPPTPTPAPATATLPPIVPTLFVPLPFETAVPFGPPTPTATLSGI